MTETDVWKDVGTSSQVFCLFNQGCFAQNGVKDQATDLIGCHEEESEVIRPLQKKLSDQLSYLV